MGVRKRSTASPDHLTMHLHSPGMTILHRAGLGGLAASLNYIERAWKAGFLTDEDVPGGPWSPGSKPWEVSPQSVTLRFGHPEGACEFLRRLFALSFRLEDRLIYLPGQYGAMPPSLAVRAEIQAGLTLTFLQHGKTRKLAKEPTTVQVDPTGSGLSLVTIEYKPCAWYKHQDGWEGLSDKTTGTLTQKRIEVIGPLNPGAVVRHVAYTSATRIEEVPERVLPLYFALVGCLALPVNRGMGVLVVPDVEDLRIFAQDRPLMTPRSARECRVASAGDAALQAQVRLRSRGLVEQNDLPGCYAARFRPTTWATQQKSRVESLLTPRREVRRHQPPAESTDERDLRLFEMALALLAPRFLAKPDKVKRGDGSATASDKKEMGYWIDSIVRPLVADNLASGQPWYTDFIRLIQSTNSTRSVSFEKEGIWAMIESLDTSDHAREMTLIQAIQEAIRRKRWRIKKESQPQAPTGKSTKATQNRQNRFMERFRLDLVNAKTADQCRRAITYLLGQALFNPRLQGQGWQEILPLLCDARRWQLVRDLAVVALVSYGRPPKTEENTTTVPADQE